MKTGTSEALSTGVVMLTLSEFFAKNKGLAEKLKYLKLGDCLPWKDKETTSRKETCDCKEPCNYYVFIRTKGNKYLQIPVEKEVYEGIAEIESEIRRSDRVFYEHNTQGMAEEVFYCHDKILGPGYLDLYHKIQQLGEVDKTIITMVVDGYTQVEVADELGIPHRTIKWKLAEMRKKLAEDETR